MQTLKELKRNIDNFNEYIYNKGFYYLWDTEYARCMHTNEQEINSRIKDLAVWCHYNEYIGSKGDFILNFKKCTKHTLQKKYDMPDGFNRTNLEIKSYTINNFSDVDEDCFVESVEILLHSGLTDTFVIYCKGFYYKQILE